MGTHQKLSFFEKITKLQTEINVPKGNFNSFGKYNYRSCEDILAAIKPHLKDLGLYINVQDELILIGDRYYIKATAMVSDGEASISSSAFAREAFEKKGMDDAQVTGSTSSYARKYALSGLLGLDDEEDSDVTNQVSSSNDVSRFKSSNDPRSYEIKFGKFQGRKLYEVGRDDISNYLDFILRKAEQDKRTPTGDVKEFIDMAREFIRG